VGGFTISEPCPEDEADWRHNWAQYLTRYDVVVAPLTTRIVWSRMLDPASATNGLIARDHDGRGIGFCHYILHENTWSLQPLCYLEDMFVAPDARRRGVARAFLERLRELAAQRGWTQVYWTTRVNNDPARALYDQVTGGPDPMVRYRIRIQPVGPR
jgi:GNAT superfamily N-acetyltransferase